MNNAFVGQQEIIRVKPLSELKLWFRWLFANLVSETICLGIIGIAGAVFSLILANSLSLSSAIVVIAALMIALGILKGVVIGYAQCLVLRRAFSDFNFNVWIAATVTGTVAALFLAAFPAFLAHFLSDHAGNIQNTALSKIPTRDVTWLMGFGLGMIISFPQWVVLRRYVKNAGFWIFANGLAWAIGLPLLFSGPAVIRAELPIWQIVFYIFAPIIAAAAAVAATQALFLVWLSKSDERKT